MAETQILMDIGEFGFHRRIREILGIPSADVMVGIGDDAAIVTPKARPLVVTQDAMVEEIHFQAEWTSAADLAYKALISNLSDLAAKAAEPAYAVIAMGLRQDTPVCWLDEFYQTLARLRKVWGIEIIGGDTVRSPILFVSIAALGYQIPCQPVRLDGAQVGDRILITGTLGDAAAGLEIVQQNVHPLDDSDSTFLVQRLLHPTPRLREMRAVLNYAIPSSMTDISDGLARDLPKLCASSRVGARIDSTRLPRSDALNRFSPSSAAFAWRGGEDYELLFTLPPACTKRLLEEWKTEDGSITDIGEIVPASDGIQVQGLTREETGGFDHFRDLENP